MYICLYDLLLLPGYKDRGYNMSFINKELKKFSIQMHPITTVNFLEVLRSFCQLLVTSIGPRSKFKIVESEGGLKILTTSSKRLIDWIELESPVLQVIANAMKGQWQIYSDFGLFTGITSISLLLNALNHNMPFNTLSNLIKFISSMTLSLLESPNIRVKVDFSSIKNLLQVVQTMITSKPLCCSPTLTNVPALTMCVVGAFIHGFSEDDNCLGRVSVLVEKGPVSETPSNFPGVLYSLPEISQESKWRSSPPNSCEKKNILVALFAVNLSTSNQYGKDAEDIEFAEGSQEVQDQVILKRIESNCEKLLEAGVSVFACQKVVHPCIQLLLQRRGALVLERMGIELADSFAALSGAVPIGDIFFGEIPEGCIGEVETVEHIVRGQKSYLLLKRESCRDGVATILAYAAGEQEAAELKVVIHQSLQSLCHLISQPFVLPGSGCLEVWLAEELQNSILQGLDKYCDEYRCSKLEMLTVLRWFRSTFLNVSKYISGTSGPVIVMDSVYHHCWSEVGASICNCGLINRNSCENFGAEWVDIEIDCVEERLGGLLLQRKWESVNVEKVSDKMIPQLDFPNVAHIDVMSSKLNAYRLALETCQTILNIGMVVY